MPARRRASASGFDRSIPVAAQCQITPAQATQLRDAIGDRIEALTILGGDYGIAAADFRSTGKFSFGESTDATLAVTKLGGSGDFGDVQPLGGLLVGWQSRLQGNLGGWKARSTCIQTSWRATPPRSRRMASNLAAARVSG